MESVGLPEAVTDPAPVAVMVAEAFVAVSDTVAVPLGVLVSDRAYERVIDAVNCAVCVSSDLETDREVVSVSVKESLGTPLTVWEWVGDLVRVPPDCDVVMESDAVAVTFDVIEWLFEMVRLGEGVNVLGDERECVAEMGWVGDMKVPERVRDTVCVRAETDASAVPLSDTDLVAVSDSVWATLDVLVISNVVVLEILRTVRVTLSVGVAVWGGVKSEREALDVRVMDRESVWGFVSDGVGTSVFVAVLFRDKLPVTDLEKLWV